MRLEADPLPSRKRAEIDAFQADAAGKSRQGSIGRCLEHVGIGYGGIGYGGHDCDHDSQQKKQVSRNRVPEPRLARRSARSGAGLGRNQLPIGVAGFCLTREGPDIDHIGHQFGIAVDDRAGAILGRTDDL